MSKKGSIHRKHSQEFKVRLVEQHLKEGISIEILAVQHQLEPRLIRSWRTIYIEHGASGLQPKAKGRPKGTPAIGRPKTTFTSEMERLQYENAKLKLEIAQLKKLQNRSFWWKAVFGVDV
ncbi:transposase [Paenibacillus validus]|uniref:Transposase n=1 Tax=Paenibacillus validus TaxID=44253 RepID=A0A7X3CRX7_9BACL|nr:MULTISPECIES: transposase [Paenibacillus]MED4603073.1 transposase [Paenibacillus validus]MED4609020.1 transposase [Paenibacillus validus]MUG69429.1 transposase [Paenibacillus validus]